MKRYGKSKFGGAFHHIAEKAIDDLFGKRKSVSAINILDSQLSRSDRQYIIWLVDNDLWKRHFKGGNLEVGGEMWDVFEAGIRGELKK